MRFGLLSVVALASAALLEADTQTPEVIVNEETIPFSLTLRNLEKELFNVSSVVISLRSVGKDFKKTYANFTKPLRREISGGELVKLDFEHVFSVPIKKYDVLLTASNGTDHVSTTQSTVQFNDPVVSWGQAAPAIAIVLALVASVAALITAIVRPDLYDDLESKLQKPKQKTQKKPTVDRATPDEPDAYLPDKFKKKRA